MNKSLEINRYCTSSESVEVKINSFTNKYTVPGYQGYILSNDFFECDEKNTYSPFSMHFLRTHLHCLFGSFFEGLLKTWNPNPGTLHRWTDPHVWSKWKAGQPMKEERRYNLKICLMYIICMYMGVSENRGTPKSSILIRFFHYKPSILGYPYFGNTHIYPPEV